MLLEIIEFLLRTIVLHSNLSLLGFLNIHEIVENKFLKVQTKALDATSEWVGVTSPTSVLECKAVQNHKSALSVLLETHSDLMI